MNLSNEILYGNLASVERAINDNATINEYDDFGFTPLIEAVIVNNADMVRLLVEHGADVNFEDVLNRTPLHWATENSNLEISKYLLEQGANANAYSIAGQSPLVMPLLHKNERVKQLLYQFNGNFNFANDYINAKLLGHRFELNGNVNIYCEPQRRFVELELEGFFLGISIGIINYSLQHYLRHFASRSYRDYFSFIEFMTEAFRTTGELIKYQHYLMDKGQHMEAIEQHLHFPLLIIPVGYQGHAITFIQYGPYLAKCDRGAKSITEGSTNIYYMRNAQTFTQNFVKDLFYKKQDPHFVTNGIHRALSLEPVIQLPVESQLSGNCSWANVEAAIPTMLFFLIQQANPTQPVHETKQLAMDMFHHWREWDKSIALNECIQSFHRASPARKATKAAILGAILFQRCNYKVKADIQRAEKLLPALTHPDYLYVLQSYLKTYWVESKTPQGYNLVQMLDVCGVDISMDA